MAVAELPARREQVQVRVDDYKAFRRDGYLLVKGLVDPAEVAQLSQFTDDMMAGSASIPGIPAPPLDLGEAERRQYYERIHMPHRALELAERFLLHPRINEFGTCRGDFVNRPQAKSEP